MISLATIEDAVRDWVVTATDGLIAEDQIWFADQPWRDTDNVPRVVIRIGALQHVGGPDGVTLTYDAGAPLGQEITYNAHGPRYLNVSLQAFSPKTVSGGQPTAWDLLAVCEAHLALPPVRSRFNVVGMGVLQEGNVSRIPTVRGTLYEDRTILEVRFCVGQSVSAKIGYIATVEVEGTIHTEQGNVEVVTEIE